MSVALFLSLSPRTEALEATLSAPGIDEDLANRLRLSSLAISMTSDDPVPPPRELVAGALSDYRTLLGLMYNAGYFGPEIHIRVNGREVSSIPPLDPPRRVDLIAIEITPGPRFVFGQAQIAPLPDLAELPEGFATGQQAKTGAIRDAARAGVTAWRNAGHPKAELDDHKVIVDHQRATVDADLRLRPGPKLRFGTFRPMGHEAVREDAIRRIAGFPEGEVFSPQKIETSARRLRRSGAFASVAMREAETPNADGTIDITAELAEQKPRRIEVGAEIESGNGLTLSGAWMHRNLFGGAERFRIEGRARLLGDSDAVDGTLRLRLDRPAVPGPDTSQLFLFEIDQLNEPHYDLFRTLAAVGFRHEFRPGLEGEVYLSPVYSRATDVYGTRTFRLAGLTGRIEWDERDATTNPTRGTFLGARITPFAAFSGGASGVSAMIDGRGYMPIGNSGRLVLAGRVQLGTIIGPEMHETSPDMLFFSGGAGTVRGQPYQSLGIPVGTGLAGGRSFLGLSAELRMGIRGPLSLVGFYDYGRIGADPWPSANDRDHAGAGLGVRYDLGGAGAVRLDIGAPVSGSTGGSLQVYIGIGQAF